MSREVSGRVAAIGKIRLFETPLECLVRSVPLQVLSGPRYPTVVQCPLQFPNQIRRPIRILPV